MKIQSFNCHSRKKVSFVDLFNLTLLNAIVILSNISELSGLKCVCNPKDCDLIRQSDCPGKGLIVWDPCKCCKICAKIEGETCGGLGGFSGICEPPLKCISKPPIIGTGVCLDLPSTSASEYKHHHHKNKICQSPVKIQPGCEIVNRKCECWHKPIYLCKENFVQWDFVNIEECELNLANLHKSEREFDEDYSIPPKASDFIKIPKGGKKYSKDAAQ